MMLDSANQEMLIHDGEARVNSINIPVCPTAHVNQQNLQERQNHFDLYTIQNDEAAVSD